MKNILGSLIMMAILAAAAVAACSDTDRKALEAFDRAWGVSSAAGDRSALMALYADDYDGLPGGQSKAAAIEGAIAAAAAQKANPSPDKVTSDHYRISCTPTSALITHRNTVWTANGTGGKPETFYSRSVHTLEKRGGKWQVVSNAGNGFTDFDTVWYLEQDWNDAFKKRDKAWFDANFASDFVSVSSESGAITGKAAEIASIMGDKSTYDVVETTGMNIRIEGNTALVTGIFHLKGKDEKGAAFDQNIRYTDAWIKRDGRWVAWSSQGTRMTEAR